MPRILPRLLLATLLAVGNAWAADPPPAEVVVAMRYLQQTGTSHAHLYLYRADGKFLRQLTDDNKSQDYNPFFAPDGETIVFTRQTDAGGTELYSVEPRGGNLHKLPAAPDWYTGAESSLSFQHLDDDPDTAHLLSDSGAQTGGPPTYRAPDGSAELVLKVQPGSEEDSMTLPGHGKLYELHDLRTGATVVLGTLPGFVGLFNLLSLGQDKTQRFLLVPPLRVAFFGLHLGSTDGDTVFALDLDGKRLVGLSPNWAGPRPLPGEPAFLTWTENRYVPFGDGKRTANCSYVERWDAKLKPVRYAREKAAGQCYGASMYRPARSPAVIYLKSNEP